MTILRQKEIMKMNGKEVGAKISELQFSLMKGSVTANKANAKPKEIKKAIARLMTHQRIKPVEVSKK